jgi:putative spermidine/putrescine transport system permease protein
MTAGEHWKAIAMLAPAALVMALLFGVGLASAFVESLSGGDGQHYRQLLADGEFLVSLRLTLFVSVTATALSAVAGFLLAVALRPVVMRRPHVMALLQAPVALPHLAMALVVINVASPSGLLARIAYALGWIEMPDQFPALLHDAYGFGIIATYVLKEAPFLALIVLAVLLRTSPEYEALARTLGASRWQRLRYVTLPLAAPALVSSSLVVLAFLFNAFEVPYLLGRPYPAMLSILAQRRFVAVDLAERPAAMAIALVMFVFTIGLCGMYLRVARSLAGEERPTLL